MTVLFKKAYDGESVVDIDRDVSECFDARFNQVAAQIPQDEHGIQKGKFTVQITWEPDEVSK